MLTVFMDNNITHTCTPPLSCSHLLEGVMETEDLLTTYEVWQSHLSIILNQVHLKTTCEDKVKWIEAMKNEIKSLEDNRGLELTSQPPGKKEVCFKWVYKVKTNTYGTIKHVQQDSTHCSRIQLEFGSDYNETFSPFVKQVSLRRLIAVLTLQRLNFIMLM